MLRYARLLVEMPIEGPFPEHIELFNDDGVLIRQPVSYEWVQTKCTHCAMLGHTEEVCKKKNVIRTEWRKIHKNPNPTQAQPVSIQNLEEQLTIPTCQEVLQTEDTLLAVLSQNPVPQQPRNSPGTSPPSLKEHRLRGYLAVQPPRRPSITTVSIL